MRASGTISRSLKLTALAVSLAAVGLAAGAQGALLNGHAYSSGAVSQVSAASLTVNGVQAAVDGSTVFVGVDPSGNLLQLAWSDFDLGDTVSLFTETESGAIVAASVFRGVLFMVQGQVTALQRDGQGKLQSVVIDGAYAIHLSQSSFDYMGAGNMGNGMGGNMSGGMMGGGMMGGGGMGGGGGMMGNGDSSFVQVGSTIAVGGLVENGLFSAVFAHIMGSDMMGNGNIQSLTRDGSGNVIGFTMNSNGTSKQCVLDSSTTITKKGLTMSPNSLRTGMHIKVGGVTRSDGSIQAKTIQIMGGGMM
jgi:hypothetical protein